ncbi:MAG: hypothetical protein J7L61_02580, partial [Thermoplasmata archaeon]|nr:hypothetical protein [Thermoplasmata archaeon]
MDRKGEDGQGEKGYEKTGKVWTEAYGCTMNQGETFLIEEAYLSAGMERASSPEDADVIIIGTCVVIDTTERKMWKRIRELSRTSSHREQRLVISGCLPPTAASRLREMVPEAYIIPPGVSCSPCPSDMPRLAAQEDA